MLENIQLDWETADGITIASLTAHRQLLRDALAKHLDDPANNYMHVEDVGINTLMIHHMTEILKYYGKE